MLGVYRFIFLSFFGNWICQIYLFPPKDILEAIAALDNQTDSKNKKARKKERERLFSCHKALCEEFERQKLQQSSMMGRIILEKDSWLNQLSTSREETILEFLQSCLYPRCIMSPADATYCAKFVLMMHDLGMANTSTLHLFDKILSQSAMHAVLFSLTECEAKNFGLFLCIILEQLTTWHLSITEFNDSAIRDRPGFVLNFLNTFLDTEHSHISHDEFRMSMHKWHAGLRICFLSCLESKEYMQLRNGMIILDKISKVFPVMSFMGAEFEKAVKLIEQTEDRADVKQMARSYYAKLRIRKPAWIPAKKFWNQPEGLKEIGELDEVEEVQESGEMMDIEQEPGEVDISDHDQSEPGEISLNEAEEKSEEVSPFKERTVVVQEIVFEDELVSKPSDKQNSAEMLSQRLAGRITEEGKQDSRLDDRNERKLRRDRNDSSSLNADKRRKLDNEDRIQTDDRGPNRIDREKDYRESANRRDVPDKRDRGRGQDDRRREQSRENTEQESPSRKKALLKPEERLGRPQPNLDENIDSANSEINLVVHKAVLRTTENDAEAIERRKIREEKDLRLKLLLQKELAADNEPKSQTSEAIIADVGNLKKQNSTPIPEEVKSRRVIIDRISKSMERPVKFERPNLSKESENENTEESVQSNMPEVDQLSSDIPKSAPGSPKLESRSDNAASLKEDASVENSVIEPDRTTESLKHDDLARKDLKASPPNPRLKATGRDGSRTGDRGDQRDPSKKLSKGIGLQEMIGMYLEEWKPGILEATGTGILEALEILGISDGKEVGVINQIKEVIIMTAEAVVIGLEMIGVTDIVVMIEGEGMNGGLIPGM